MHLDAASCGSWAVGSKNVDTILRVDDDVAMRGVDGDVAGVRNDLDTIRSMDVQRVPGR